jgi:hypothetical protein
VFDQVIHAKIVNIFLDEIKLMVVVAGGGLKFVEGLYDCVGNSESWVSGTVTLKL